MAEGGSQARAGSDGRQRAGGEERVGDAAGQLRASAAPAEPAAIVVSTAIPIDPPISWPVVLRPESIPVSSSPAPVSTETETETRATPRPTPATSIPGSRSAA